MKMKRTQKTFGNVTFGKILQNTNLLQLFEPVLCAVGK